MNAAILILSTSLAVGAGGPPAGPAGPVCDDCGNVVKTGLFGRQKAKPAPKPAAKSKAADCPGCDPGPPEVPNLLDALKARRAKKG
ncbi:MAG: hypothetical protein K2X87_26310 [Gemmataceae bacterium]|nr:hypothetical protein [Gemmataceae bacterium]